jgi:transposase
MERKRNILGVDVSKLTLDITCHELGKHIRISNNTEGFRLLLKWCKEMGINLNDAIIIMEYTGGYEFRFVQFCESKFFVYCRVPGYEIKHSLGLTRGKNDKVDSKRIAQYGDEKIKKLEPSKPLNIKIMELRHLLSYRKRIVRDNAGFLASVKERKHMYGLDNKDFVIKNSNARIKKNEKDIKAVDKQIMEIIKGDTKMLFNYAIITSIKGIGPVNAWMTIAYTENFTSFPTARAYAVYVGVVPFDHSSGTSIKGKRRVSNMANKEVKQELNQAAKTAMVYDQELKAYSTEKLKNKAYGLVLNNVKFKLILRMFSLIKRGEKYVENYKKAV